MELKEEKNSINKSQVLGHDFSTHGRCYLIPFSYEGFPYSIYV